MKTGIGEISCSMVEPAFAGVFRKHVSGQTFSHSSFVTVVIIDSQVFVLNVSQFDRVLFLEKPGCDLQSLEEHSFVGL